MSESERVVCLGDSLTEGLGDQKGLGWVGRLALDLAQRFPGAWHVNNLGVAGDTSLDIRHRLMSEVLPRCPARLIIAAGVNDTTSRLWPNETGCKVDQTYARDVWRQMLGVVQKNGIKTLVLGLCPVREDLLPLRHEPYDETDRGHDARNARIESYESMLAAEARYAGFPFVPLFDALGGMNYAENLRDGVHPNARGYDLLFSLIKEAAQETAFFCEARGG